MAYIETPYGLRYNDDGSLCMTIRQDDVPFPGVDSWAVEEGTTNWFTYPMTQEYRGGNLLTAGSYYTTENYRIVATNQPKSSALPGCRINATGGKKFAISGFTNLTSVVIYYKGFDSSGNTLFGQSFVTAIPDNNHKFSHIFDFSSYSDLSFVHFGIGSTSTPNYYVEYIQVEEKPYATSFVDGTRAHGLIKLDNSNIDIKDFVINFWAKNVRVPSTTGHWLHYLDIVLSSSSSNIICLCAPPVTVGTLAANELNVTNTKSHSATRYPTGFNLADEQNKWHMFTLLGTGATIYFFIDGQPNLNFKHTQATTTSEFINIGRYGLNLSGTGTETGTHTADLFIGHYYDKNGNAIWTDDFIREVYESKAPIVVAK